MCSLVRTHQKQNIYCDNFLLVLFFRVGFTKSHKIQSTSKEADHRQKTCTMYAPNVAQWCSPQGTRNLWTHLHKNWPQRPCPRFVHLQCWAVSFTWKCGHVNQTIIDDYVWELFSSSWESVASWFVWVAVGIITRNRGRIRVYGQVCWKLVGFQLP